MLAGTLASLLSHFANAQALLFAEDFANGIPPTWTHLSLGVPIDPWSAGTSPATNSPDVFHEWFCNHGGLTRDNVLITPAIDLTGFVQADFSCVQHQMFPLQRSVNRVEVSTDGGNSFTTLYDETGTWSGPGTIQASLDAYAGLPDVRIAFHYIGAVANEWRIDDVRITTSQPALDITNLTAGSNAVFTGRACGANALVVFALSIAGGGPLPSPFGLVGLTPPIELLPVVIADTGGNATANLPIPSSAVGIGLHAQLLAWSPSGAIRLSNWRLAVIP